MTTTNSFPANGNQILSKIEAPCMWVNLDALDKNIAEIFKKTATTKVRIASKSIRSIDALKYISSEQKNAIGLMTFSAEEAAILIENGFKDILMGYPSLEFDSLIKAQQLAIKHQALLTFMVDLPEHIDMLEKVGEITQSTISCCIDIDLSVKFPGLYFGVFRSSIASPKILEKLLKHIAPKNHIKIWGLMGYEAQVAGVADNTKGQTFMNQIIRFLKKKSLPIIAQRRKACADIIRNFTGSEIQINGGGTGSIQNTLCEEGITEVTVGSGYFQSHIFDQFVNINHTPAAGFALRITRNPAPNIFTCQSGGYIASGPINTSKQPCFYYPSDLKWLKNEGFGEVQTPFISKSNALKVGDLIFLRHAKAGELSEHFETIHLIKHNAYFGTWKTYRGNHFSFH